jgi:hypothetical protein
VGVFVLVGVCVGVCVFVGVCDGVFVGDAVIEGVGVGVNGGTGWQSDHRLLFTLQGEVIALQEQSKGIVVEVGVCV